MDSDDQQNIYIYQSLLAKYGENFRALDWGSRESQAKRFEVLARLGMEDGDHVLDVGCGLADFYDWLLVHKPGVKYSGIDITPAMIESAHARFPNIWLNKGTLFDLDFSANSFDYLVASGIFVFRKENPEEYMCSTIREMFKICRKGIGFNSLSAWASKKSPDEFYADPLRIVNYCYTLSSSIVLYHDYHQADFTVFIYK